MMQIVLPIYMILQDTVGSPSHGHVQHTDIYGSYIDDHGTGEIYITKRATELFFCSLYTQLLAHRHFNSPFYSLDFTSCIYILSIHIYLQVIPLFQEGDIYRKSDNESFIIYLYIPDI